jgi:hypothetical protein
VDGDETRVTVGLKRTDIEVEGTERGDMDKERGKGEERKGREKRREKKKKTHLRPLRHRSNAVDPVEARRLNPPQLRPQPRTPENRLPPTRTDLRRPHEIHLSLLVVIRVVRVLLLVPNVAHDVQEELDGDSTVT